MDALSAVIDGIRLGDSRHLELSLGDNQAFNRAFQRCVGESPGRYRRADAGPAFKPGHPGKADVP